MAGGFTLAELLIVVTVLGVLLAACRSSASSCATSA
jgi:prepilin-type N-terminal cleavage/methylation domain-containing protein